MSRDINIDRKQLDEYINIIELSGVTLGHIKELTRALEKYLDYINYRINKSKSLTYFKKLKNTCSIAYYKKQMYQIKKFLKYLGIEWISGIKLPPDPDYTPKRITINDIKNTLDYFRNDVNYNRYKAIILLGYTSGLRAEEIYKLERTDIDLNNRTINIIHNPKTNHSTKNKKSRISFITSEARDALNEYFHDIKDSSKTLFPQSPIEKAFRKSSIKVKDLRKAFSQEWTRRNGDTGVKKVLMGHSLKKDIDLQHYNAQSPEDLKRIYDRVMNQNKELLSSD